MRLAGLLTLLACVSAFAADKAAPVFTDVTDSAGINFTHRFGDHELDNIVEGTGAGAVFFDYDGDGYLDIYLINGAWDTDINDNRGRNLQGKLANALYRNKGDGTFVDVTAKAGVGNKAFGFGGSAADFDSDGDLDLYVLNYRENVFYRNNGDGTFTDISAKSGLANALWSVSAPWLDYDNDGDLDVYVANYLEYDSGKFRSYYAAAGYPGPLSYNGRQDALYRNNGDGTFADVTAETGLTKPQGRAMSATAVDFNGDGYLDIFVANDAMQNYYFQNTGKGSFKEQGLMAGLAYGENGQGVSSMGPVTGDLDNDGKLDVFIPDMGFGSLLMNRGILFEDQIAPSKLAVMCGQFTGWGGILFDYDNDGDQDLFVTNGNAHHEYSEEDILAANNGKGVFTDVGPRSGAYFKEKFVGRGSTYADFDNDGDVDILIVNLNGPAKLLRNDGGNTGNWLTIQARLPGGNSDAIGARVTITSGGKTQIRDVVGVTGYLSQGDLRVHFGLGKASKVEKIEIRWPDRSVMSLKNVKANQILTVVQKAQ